MHVGLGVATGYNVPKAAGPDLSPGQRQYPYRTTRHEHLHVVLGLLLAKGDPGLVPRTPLERCSAYGVRILRKENGDVFAHHNVAGVVGPCHDEQEAAALACATWDF
jgi:hypothetical protein